MASVFGLVLDVFPHRRLRDRDTPPLATVQLQEIPAQRRFWDLKTDVLSSIRHKAFVTGSVPRGQLSALIARWTWTDAHLKAEPGKGLELEFHFEDPTRPSGLSPEPCRDRVLDTVLDKGRGMVCILSGPAAEGLEVGGAGGGAAGAGAAAAQGRRPREVKEEEPEEAKPQPRPPPAKKIKPDPDAASQTGFPGGNGAAHLAPAPFAQAGPLEEEKPRPQTAGRGGRRALQEVGGGVPAGPAPWAGRRVVDNPPVVPLTLSVLAERHGEVRLEVPSSTTVGEVLDMVPCSGGVSPRDRQLFIYQVRHSRDPGAALALSAPLSLYAPPGATTLPLALRGETSAVERARRGHAREQARVAREGLFAGIGGRKDGVFYIFAESVIRLGQRYAQKRHAQALQWTVVLQYLRPDSTVEALMAEVERKLGIPIGEQLLFSDGRLLQKRKGDPAPFDPPMALLDEEEEKGDWPAWAPPAATKRKPDGAPLTLLDYRIDPDSVIRVVRMGPSRLVIVRSLTGKMFSVRVGLTDTVDTLKLRIEDREGVPTDQQRLIFGGRQIEDGRLLTDYGVEGGSTVHLVTRLRGS